MSVIVVTIPNTVQCSQFNLPNLVSNAPLSYYTLCWSVCSIYVTDCCINGEEVGVSYPKHKSISAYIHQALKNIFTIAYADILSRPLIYFVVGMTAGHVVSISNLYCENSEINLSCRDVGLCKYSHQLKIRDMTEILRFLGSRHATNQMLCSNH